MEVLEQRPLSGSLQPVAWATLHQGEPVLAAGVHEVDRRDDPLELEPHGTSVALVLEKDGRREWWLLADHLAGAPLVVSTPERSRFASFDRWVDVQAATVHGEQLGPEVTFTAGGELEVAAHATLLAGRSGIDLGPGFAGPGARTAVAKVQHEGVVWFVLARDVGGVPEYLPAISDATTIDEYLDEVRHWYGPVI